MTIAFYNYYNDDEFISVFNSYLQAAAWLKRSPESMKAAASMILNKKIDNSIYTPNGRAKLYVYKD